MIAKLRAGSMPPAGRPRPDAATYRAVASALENDIDRAWAAIAGEAAELPVVAAAGADGRGAGETCRLGSIVPFHVIRPAGGVKPLID